MKITKTGTLKTCMISMCVLVLNGCASYGTSADPFWSGDYYDQYSPAYDYYPGQAAYPYPPGYYGPYYGPRVIFGPSIYFGTSRGSSGVGVGTSFGF